jgi:hypothetical protein
LKGERKKASKKAKQRWSNKCTQPPDIHPSCPCVSTARLPSNFEYQPPTSQKSLGKRFSIPRTKNSPPLL